MLGRRETPSPKPTASDIEDGGSRWLRSYARWVVRHRLVVAIGLTIATIALGLSIGRLHIEVDPDRQLPQDHPFIQALNEVHHVFGDKNLVVIGLFPHDRDVYTPAFLAKVREITDRIAEIPGANADLIQSLASPRVKSIRGSDEGMEVERVMDDPPSDLAGARAVRERVLSNPMFVDTLVTEDGTAVAIQASFQLTPEIPDYRRLEAAVRGALAKSDDGTFDAHVSGIVVFLAQISAYTARIAYTFPLALLVIGLVHYHAFRTFQALFLPILTALLSVAWALGMMGLVGVPLDPFNMTTPVLILAVAAGHAVQILKRFYEEYQRCEDVDEAIVASLVHVGPVMISAGLVAALSFASLVTFRTATIQTFGLFTAFGILSALVIEMTIIPAVRAMLPAPKAREREREALAHPWLDRILAAPARWARSPKARRNTLIATLALIWICAGLATRIDVDMSLKRQFWPSDRVRADDTRINDAFAGTNTLLLTVEGNSEGALEEPAVLQAIDRVERALEREPGVGRASSYVDFIAQMHRAMNADRPDAGTLPATRRLAAQYLFLYSLSGGADDFDSIIDPTHRIAKVRMLVHEDSTRYGAQLIERARELVRENFPEGIAVRYTGTLASTAAATEVMVTGKVWNIVQIVLITWFVAAVLLRSFVGGLLVVVPLALTVAVNFGAMGLIALPLDSVTSAIAAMAVGIGADYAMYFLFRTREELGHGLALEEAIDAALRSSGKAILFVSTAIACGYATLCLSGFGIHMRLGTLVALAMITSSAGALFLLPVILTTFRPAFLWSHAYAALAAARAGGAAAEKPAEPVSRPRQEVA
jgi:uncharacterized protein